MCRYALAGEVRDPGWWIERSVWTQGQCLGVGKGLSGLGLSDLSGQPFRNVLASGHAETDSST